MHLASLRLLHTPIQSGHPLCSPCWKKRLHTKYNTFGTWRSSKRLHLRPPTAPWWYRVCYYRNFSIGEGGIYRAATVSRNATKTRRMLFLFLMFNRNARWCSSTSGSNLLPVRLHRAIDNRAATTTSLVCTYACSFMLLICKCASVETRWSFFPPPSNAFFDFRFAIVKDIRCKFSSLRARMNIHENTKIWIINKFIIYINSDLQRYFIALRENVFKTIHRNVLQSISDYISIDIYIEWHHYRDYFWQLFHNLKDVTSFSFELFIISEP